MSLNNGPNELNDPIEELGRDVLAACGPDIQDEEEEEGKEEKEEDPE